MRNGLHPATGRSQDQSSVGLLDQYGEYVTGNKVINEESRAAMREALANIQNGEYAKSFIMEGAHGYPSMTARRRNNAEHLIETTGAKLRDMMPWIKAGKVIDKDVN